MRTATLLRRRTGRGGGLRLPGTAGNYASSPDSVLNSVTGDIDIRVCAKLDDWTPATEMALIAKYAGVQQSFYLSVTVGGNLRFLTTSDGVTAVDTNRGPIGFADGATGWVRVTRDVDNGAGGNDTKFYTSADGLTWTQLSTSSVGTGVTSIFDSTSPIEIGSRSTGTNNPLTGTIYYAEVRNGIDGPVVARFDASKVQSSGAQVPATINGWTPNGTALYRRDDYVRLPGTAGNYLSFPDTAANSVTGDIDVRAKLSLDDWTPAAQQTFLSKYTGTGNHRGHWFYVQTTGVLVFQWSPDGTTPIAKSSTVNLAALADGAVKWARATLDVDNGAAGNDVKFYTSDDGMTWTQLGATVTTAGVTSIFDNTTEVQIGAQSGADRLAGNVYAAEVRNGIGGEVVASFDARDITTPWTINGTGWSWEGASFAGAPRMALSLTSAGLDRASTPDWAGFPTGDIDIRAKLSMTDWTPAATNYIMAKYVGNAASFGMRLNATGTITTFVSGDGLDANFKYGESAVTGLADGTTKWVRCTVAINSAGASRFSHYLSDDGIVWTPLGATATAAPITSIHDSAAALAFGALTSTGTLPMNGTLHYAEVRNGIDGPIVARFDPTAIARTGTRTPTTTVQPGGTPNMLTPNQASIETDATGWAVNLNCTIARSTAQFLDGGASLELTATAVGASAAVTTPTTAVPVVPGKSYAATLSMRAAITARTCRAIIEWYTAALGFISSSNGAGAADSAAAWTSYTVSAVAPATAAFARVLAQVNDATQLATEVHYADRISLVESAATWTMNGTAWDLVQV